MDVINGSDLFVFMNGAVVAYATAHTLNPSMKTRLTSNKDSGDFETRAAGRSDVTASCSGLVVYASGFKELFAAVGAKAPVTLQFGQKAAGVQTIDVAAWYASGEFYITNLTLEASDDENSTYSATFEHESGFTFTGSGVLAIREAANVKAATNASDDGMAAVYVTGGIAPYTFAWDISVETTNPAVALEGTFTTGKVHTVTVTDSTPVTPLTGELEITVFAVVSA